MIQVSIIVAVYNAAPFISGCLDSLLNQSESSLEIIVIDDGSTDGTLALLENYASMDQRVSVIHQRNSGVSAARNAGLEVARGRFVCFIDGDDWVETEMVREMVSAADTSGAEVVVAGAIVDFHDSDDRVVKSDPRLLRQLTINKGFPISSDLIDDNFINLVGYVWNKFYDRECLIRSKQLFDPDLSLFEDLDFNSRILSAVECVTFIPDAYVHYVQRPRQSLGSAHSANFFALRSDAIHNIDFLLQNWGADEEMRRQQVAKASSLALWEGLRVASKALDPRKTLIRLSEHPGAAVLVSDSKRGKLRTGRGIWASFMISQGWFWIALSPILIGDSIRKFNYLFK